jgi:predicted aspartyl protease
MNRREAITLMAGLGLAPTWAAQAAARGRVQDFAFVHGRQILFPIVVNGQPAEAWLDSGAGATVLDAAFAQKLGLASAGGVQAHGVTGAVGGARRAVVDLNVGDVAMPSRRVVVMDLSVVARAVQRPVEVLLGRDMFDLAVVDIDFQARRIGFLPRATFTPPPGASISLRPSADLRSFPIVVAGVPTEAILDLGNAGALLLDAAFVERHGLLSGRKRSTELGIGADGPHEHTLVGLDKIEVGGLTFNGVPTVASPGLSSSVPANVGLQILSRFRLTIDFAGDRLWMAPDAGAATLPFRRNRTGLSLTPSKPGALVVDHVAAGSPAALGGWKAGDLIVALDGAAIPADYAAGEASQWIYGAPGRTVTLTLNDGRQRQLTLADYF